MVQTMQALQLERAPVASGIPGPARGLPLFVDAAPLRESRLTGIARFVARLVAALAKRRSLRLFLPGLSQDVPLDIRRLPDPMLGVDEWVRGLWKLPRRRHDPQLARAATGLYTVLRPEARYFRREIGIFYDFTPFVMPGCHADSTRENFGAFFGKTAALCDRLVAISQSTRHDASWLSTARSSDVVVGYPGPSLCVNGHAARGESMRRSNVILVVAALEPRKNGPFVLDWFLRSPALPQEMELWWVGPRAWWARAEHLRELESRPGSRRVRFLGMVSDSRLCELYRESAFSIYPSLYEGFGFPVLDSLMHETPVLCSFNSSLQEFACPGVYYFDPGNRESLDTAWRTACTTPRDLVDEKYLRQRYSWDRLAEKVLALVDEDQNDTLPTAARTARP
jgi:glycosyltransferase involved in cell wall biosynthesis